MNISFNIVNVIYCKRIFPLTFGKGQGINGTLVNILFFSMI